MRKLKFKVGDIIYIKCIYITKTKIQYVWEERGIYEITFDNGVVGQVLEEEIYRTKIETLWKEHSPYWRILIGFPFDEHFKASWRCLFRDLFSPTHVSPLVDMKGDAE